jgi:hypothetical protein
MGHHYQRLKAYREGMDHNQWYAPHEAVRLVAEEQKISRWVDETLAICDEYVQHYQVDEKWTILETETVHETMFAGQRLTGRVDLVVEYMGQVYGVDHKTTGRITKQHVDYFTISGQFLGYERMVMDKYGDRYAGFIINLIQTTTPKFERVVLPARPHAVKSFPQTVADAELMIRHFQQQQRPVDQWPKSLGEQSCYRRYGPCPYVRECLWGEGAPVAGNFSGQWSDERQE